MKKFLINISIFGLLATTLSTGCKKADFDENYFNPEKAVTADVPRLYAGLFKNDVVMPKYWNLYTFHVPTLGTYSQTAGFGNGKGIYEQTVSYNGNRWDNFYTTVIARYREIEKYYNTLSDEDKAGYQLFLETSRIFLYDHATQMVDLYGDIPFTEAGSLNAEGKIILPAYTPGVEVYTEAITELQRISDYLATTAPSSFYLNQLKAYDFVNGGDITKWRQYCNSLLLRLAMRISYQNETTAKAVVQKILGDATKYPVVTTALGSIRIEANGPTSNLVPEDRNEIRNGFLANPFAPGKMVNDIMVPSGDPRLPLYFTKNVDGEYKGINNTLTDAEVTEGTTAGEFSRIDSTTFQENFMLPGLIILADEVYFLKAEAYERWGGGDAKAAYEQGIRESIAFWSYINGKSPFAVKESVPTEAEITTFLASPLVAYGTDNLNKIATQKWIAFNISQANHAWAELRRTKMPALTWVTDGASTIAPNVATRIMYPTGERSLNAANFEAVKAKDTYTTRIFWDVK